MQYDAHQCQLQFLAKLYSSINDDHKFKIINCNDYGHTTNNNGVCIHWSLHSEDSSNLQIISGMLQQLMDLRGEYFESYRCVDRSTNVECIN